MSGLARRLTEAPAPWRWHTSRLLTGLLYRRAFAAIGAGTVIVRPHRLQGTERIEIGRDCAIYEGVWLGTEGAGRLVIGDRCYLGHQVHVHALDNVRIGADCVLADGVLVTSADHDREDRHRTHGTGPVHIEDRVFLGQRAVVLGGVTIGAGATVAAHAVVTRDVPAGATVAGAPARPIDPPGAPT